jgi:YggT family protein
MNFARGFGFSLLGLVFWVMDAYSVILIVRALISWVSPDPRNPVVQLLVRLTEPVQRPLRKLAPPEKLGGLDLSPMLAILLIQFVKNGIVYSLGGQPRMPF